MYLVSSFFFLFSLSLMPLYPYNECFDGGMYCGCCLGLLNEEVLERGFIMFELPLSFNLPVSAFLEFDSGAILG